MQHSKTLTKILREIAALVEQEAQKNPEFALELERILQPVARPVKGKRREQDARKAPLPDVYREFQTRGEEEFKFWLRDMDRGMLRSIVKMNGFDPSRLSNRWVTGEKFVSLITEQVKAR